MKRQTKTNDTPLFDEAAYNKIMKSIDDQLAKLYSIQTEIMTERAKARGEAEAENRRRAVEDSRILRAIKTPKLPSLKRKTQVQPDKAEPKKKTGAKKKPAAKKPA